MDSFTQLPAKAGRGGDLHSFQPRQQEGAGRFHPASSQSRPGGGLCLFASSEWQTQRECTANTPASSKDSRRATPAGGGGEATIPATAHLAM